jgi:hypothetical protein
VTIALPTTGSPISLSAWGVPVTNAVNALSDAVLVAQAVMVTRTGAGQSIPNAAQTAVAFTSVDRDDTGLVNLGTNATTVTIQKAGIYLATARLSFPLNGTGIRQISIVVNGAQIYLLQTIAFAGSTGAIALTTAGMWNASPGDTVQMWCYQNSGAAATLNSGTNEYPRLAVARLAI